MHVNLEVVSTEDPNPAFRRIVFTGENIEPLLRAKHADAYVKLLFPAAGDATGDEHGDYAEHGARRDAPRDATTKDGKKAGAKAGKGKVKKNKQSEKRDKAEKKSAARIHHGKPCTRSYTLAAVDRERRTVTVDFTRHDGGGPGYAWAVAARPGDTIASSLPRGSYSPGKGADALFVVADTPGLPAARRVVAAAKKPKRIRVIVDTSLSEAELELPKKVHSVTIVDSAATGTTLHDALEAAAWPKGTVELFARGEKTVTKRLIGRLARERGLDRSRASISGYWSAPRSS